MTNLITTKNNPHATNDTHLAEGDALGIELGDGDGSDDGTDDGDGVGSEVTGFLVGLPD